MTRAEQIRGLLEEYAARRRENADALRRREEEAYRLDPEIRRLREEAVATAVGAMRKSMGVREEARLRAIAEEMRERGRAINAEIRFRLQRLGLKENYLEMAYRCPLCRDTGYVGDAPARFCACFERRLSQMRAGENPAIARQTFETFEESRIPEENNQRLLLLGARRICEEYADGFPETRWKNVLLLGAGGLGKTFLLNCVYERVTRRGFAALNVTAYQMFERMRKQHVGSDLEAEGFRDMLETPLLLIDDLGTEPIMRNITIEYLFTLLNERMTRGQHTFLATNLNRTQIMERYGERVASRLFDKTAGVCIRLEGKDLRTL